MPGECLESVDLAVAVDDFRKPRAKCFPRKAELDRAPNLKQAWHGMVQDSMEAWIFCNARHCRGRPIMVGLRPRFTARQTSKTTADTLSIP